MLDPTSSARSARVVGFTPNCAPVATNTSKFALVVLIVANQFFCTMENTTFSKKRRVDYIVACLENFDDLVVRQQLGIRQSDYKQKLIAKLRTRGDLEDEDRSGRPKKHQESQFLAARNELIYGDVYICSKAELVEVLVDRGVLAPGTSPRGFVDTFSKYMRARRESVSFGAQRLTFALSLTHIESRLVWAVNNKKVYTDQSVKEMTFEDEVTIELGVNPKGESQSGRVFTRGGLDATVQQLQAWIRHHEQAFFSC